MVSELTGRRAIAIREHGSKKVSQLFTTGRKAELRCSLEEGGIYPSLSS